MWSDALVFAKSRRPPAATILEMPLAASQQLMAEAPIVPDEVLSMWDSTLTHLPIAPGNRKLFWRGRLRCVQD